MRRLWAIQTNNALRFYIETSSPHVVHETVYETAQDTPGRHDQHDQSSQQAAALKSDVVHGAKWSVLEKWSARIISLVTFAILGRLVAPRAFGLIAMAMVVIVLFTVFVENGVSDGVIRAEDLTDDLKDTAFWLSFASGVLLCGICFASSAAVGSLYHEPQLGPVLKVLGLALVFQSLNSIQQALLQRSFQFRPIALRRFVATLIGGTVGIVWALVSPSVWALVAQYIVGSAISTLVLWSATTYRPRFHVDATSARQLAHFGVNVMGIQLLSFLTEQGDNFVVGLMLGTTELGYYAVAYRIYAIVTELVTGALSAVALPTFSRLQSDPVQIVRAVLKATRLSVTIAVPFFGVTGVLARYIVPIVFGTQWARSVPVMEVLACVGLLNSVVFFDRSVLIAAGRVQFELAIVFFAAVCNLIAFWIGAHWGIVGVATALVIRSYVFWPLRLLSLRIAVGMPVGTYLWQWFRPVLSGMAMVASMLAAGRIVPESFRAGLLGVLGIAVYLLTLAIASPDNLREIKDLLRSAAGTRKVS